jgi:hypothetical protein
MKEMPWIFSKADFAIHPIRDFLVVDLLLDAKFGQLSRFSD